MRDRIDALRLAPAAAALSAQDHLRCLVWCAFHPRDKLQEVLDCHGVDADKEFNLTGMDQAQQEASLAGEFPALLKQHQPALIVTTGGSQSALAIAKAAKACDIPLAVVCPSLKNPKFQPDSISMQFHQAVASEAALLLVPDNPTAIAAQEVRAPDSQLCIIGSLAQECLVAARRLIDSEMLQELNRGMPYIPEHERYLLVIGTPPDIETGTLETLRHNLLALLQQPEWHIIFPVELGEQQEPVYRQMPWHERLYLKEPLSYLLAIHLAENADAVMTTSPGVMETVDALGVTLLDFNSSLDNLPKRKPSPTLLIPERPASAELTKACLALLQGEPAD